MSGLDDILVSAFGGIFVTEDDRVVLGRAEARVAGAVTVLRVGGEHEVFAVFAVVVAHVAVVVVFAWS